MREEVVNVKLIRPLGRAFLAGCMSLSPISPPSSHLVDPTGDTDSCKSAGVALPPPLRAFGAPRVLVTAQPCGRAALLLNQHAET